MNDEATLARYEAALRQIGTPAHVPRNFDPFDWWQHLACKRAQTAREALGINAEDLIRATLAGTPSNTDIIRRFLTGGYSAFPFKHEMRDEALAALNTLTTENEWQRQTILKLLCHQGRQTPPPASAGQTVSDTSSRA